MTVKEGASVTPAYEPEINLNEPSNEPPLVQATLYDDKVTSSGTAVNVPMATAPGAVAAAGTTTTTTTYTVPPPAATVPSGTPVNVGHLGREPKQIQCPYCGVRTVTNPKTQIDCFTVVMAVLILLLFWPLFWLPFVIPCCKSSEHYCGSCHRKVGTTAPCS